MPAIKERDGGIISGQPVMERLIFSTGWLLKTIENYWKLLKTIDKKTLSSSQPWGAMWGSPELWGCWSILWVTCMWRWPGRLKWFGMRKAITSHCEQWEFMQQMNNTKICLYESKGVGLTAEGWGQWGDNTARNSSPPFLTFTLRWGSKIFSSKRCRRDVEDQGLDKTGVHCKTSNQKSWTTWP